MKSETFIIADDHPLLLKGLGDFLKSQRYDVVKACNDGTSAYQAIMDLQPAFAILDIEMPYLSGIQISELVLKTEIATKLILISYEIESSIVSYGQKLGIRGFILKEDALNEIVQCVAAIKKGEVYVSKGLKGQVRDDSPGLIETLTPTEIKLIKRISEGMSSREISEHYSISERTVEKHRSNIISKLQLEGGQFALMTWVAENKTTISKI